MKWTHKNPSNARVFVLVRATVIIAVRQYLDHAVDILMAKNNENAKVDIQGPRFQPRGDHWRVAIFSATVVFESGHKLEISDNFERTVRDGWDRTFAYYFGLSTEQEPSIFLFDNHGFFGGEEHLHLADGERLRTGDPRLNGYEPNNVDITEVLRLVDLHFNNDPFPWTQA